MASLDTDINMVPGGEGSSGAGPSSSSKKPKRFEIKKWNAVALWAWGNNKINNSPSLSLSKTLNFSISFFFFLLKFKLRSYVFWCRLMQISLSIIVRSAGTISWISVSVSPFSYFLDFFCSFLGFLWFLLSFVLILMCRHRVPGQSSQRDERGVHRSVGYASDPLNPSFNMFSFFNLTIRVFWMAVDVIVLLSYDLESHLNTLF